MSRSSKTRRDLLRTWAVAGGYSVALRTRAAAAPAAKVEDARVISMRPHLYHGWPTLTRRKDSELLVVCSGGRQAHVCPFGWVEIMRSKDDGRTWSWPRVLMDTAIDDRDAGVCETAQGSLLVTTFTSLAYVDYLTGKRVAEWSNDQRRAWNAAHERTSAAERERTLGTWMLRSSDGGVTWSAPYRVPVNSPHGPIPLRDGRVIYAGKRLWHNKKRIGVADSRDDGRTWRWLAEIPSREGDDFAEYHELHVVEGDTGALIVQIRNHNRANHREILQTESVDGGRTWSTPHPIGVWGLPSHLLRLRDGRLMMTYGYRRKPFGNQARISEDSGATWSRPVTISDDGGESFGQWEYTGVAGDLGYPSTVELDDGSLVTVWYERMRESPRAVLRQANWRLLA